MNLIELRAVRQALREKLAQLDRIVPLCGSCIHFPAGRCEKYGSVPPLEFQRQPEACDDWQHDGVPF